MKELSNFRKFNGLLRIFVLILGVISIGLTVSRFRRNEINEIIFLGASIFSTIISFVHFFLSFLIGCNHGGKCFRVGDFVYHLMTGLLLLVSSTLMLMIASKKGATLDYRFQDSKHVLARTIAAILGLQNSSIYLLISYLTITEKQFIYCQRLPNRKPKADKVEAEAGSSSAPTNNGSAVPAPSTGAPSPETIQEASANVEDISTTTSASSFRLLCHRYTWRRIISDDVLETRLLIVLLGSINVGILSTCFQTGNELEEYFLSVTIICLIFNLMAQILYALGLIQLEASVIIIVDIIMQVTSSFLLILGGSLMLGSTIENSYHVDLQNKIIERTVSSLIGILTGILHFNVGIAVKRTCFSKSFTINPSSSELTPKPMRNGHKKPSPASESAPTSATANSVSENPPEASCVIV